MWTFQRNIEEEIDYRFWNEGRKTVGYMKFASFSLSSPFTPLDLQRFAFVSSAFYRAGPNCFNPGPGHVSSAFSTPQSTTTQTALEVSPTVESTLPN